MHLAEGVRLQAEVLDAYARRGIAVGGGGVHGFQLRGARRVAHVRQARPLGLETAGEGKDDTIRTAVEVPRAGGGRGGCRARRHDAMRAAARGGRSRDAGSEHAVLSRRRHPSPSRDWKSG